MFLFSHSISLSIFLYLLLSISLSLYHRFKKIMGPQSLLQIGGDRGTIKTVNLAVCKDVT